MDAKTYARMRAVAEPLMTREDAWSGPRYRARHDDAFGDAVPVGPWMVDSGEFPSYDGS